MSPLTTALVAPSKRVTHRLETDAWAVFWNAPLPPSLWDFIYQSMWCKLRVRVRLFPWLQVKDCPLCSKDETVCHALKYYAWEINVATDGGHSSITVRHWWICMEPTCVY